MVAYAGRVKPRRTFAALILLSALAGVACGERWDEVRPGSQQCPIFPPATVWTWAVRAPDVAVVVNATSGCMLQDPALRTSVLIRGPDRAEVPATIRRNPRAGEGEFIVEFVAPTPGWYDVAAIYEPTWGSSRVRVLVVEPPTPFVAELPYACRSEAGRTRHGTWFCYNQAHRDGKTLQILPSTVGSVADDVLWVRAASTGIFHRFVDTGSGPLSDATDGGVAPPLRSGNDALFWGSSDVLVAEYEGALSFHVFDGASFVERGRTPLAAFAASPRIRRRGAQVELHGQISIDPPMFTRCEYAIADGGTIAEIAPCEEYPGWYAGASDGVLWSVDEVDAVHAFAQADGGVVDLGTASLPPLPPVDAGFDSSFGNHSRPWRADGRYYEGATVMGPAVLPFAPPSSAWTPRVQLVPRLGDGGVYFELAASGDEFAVWSAEWFVVTLGKEPVRSRLRPLD